MPSGVPCSALPVGVEWTVLVGGSLAVGAGRSVNVYARGTTTQVSVYPNQALTGAPLTQPLTTDSSGNVPGYIAAEQQVDFYDVASGLRAQAEPLSVADLIGSDGQIGGPGSLGLSAGNAGDLALLGSDDTVGGPGGSPLSPTIALVGTDYTIGGPSGSPLNSLIVQSGAWVLASGSIALANTQRGAVMQTAGSVMTLPGAPFANAAYGCKNLSSGVITVQTPTLATVAALSTGSPITSVPLTVPLGYAIAAGVLLWLAGTGGPGQLWTVGTGGAAAGATSIPVTSQTPNFAYPSGSTLQSVIDDTGLPSFTVGSHDENTDSMLHPIGTGYIRT